MKINDSINQKNKTLLPKLCMFLVCILAVGNISLKFDQLGLIPMGEPGLIFKIFLWQLLLFMPLLGITSLLSGIILKGNGKYYSLAITILLSTALLNELTAWKVLQAGLSKMEISDFSATLIVNEPTCKTINMNLNQTICKETSNGIYTADVNVLWAGKDYYIKKTNDEQDGSKWFFLNGDGVFGIARNS